MYFLIAGATGFIGQALVKYLLNKQHHLIVVGRNKAKITDEFGTSVVAYDWDELSAKGEGLLANINFIINLAGENIAQSHWSEQRQQEILESRIQTTELLASLCTKLGHNSPALFNASGVGIYGSYPDGDKTKLFFDEHSSIDYEHNNAFTAYIAKRWEKAAQPAISSGVRVVFMRFGAVLAKGGGALAKLTFPFQLGLGSILGSGKQPFSWIALPEVINIIDFLIARSDISGPINFVAPQFINQSEFARALANRLNRPLFLKMPAFLLTMLLGQMADELLLKGQYVKPSQLLSHGYQFQYPDIQSALHAVV